jgi:hypothetical protein
LSAISPPFGSIQYIQSQAVLSSAKIVLQDNQGFSSVPSFIHKHFQELSQIFQVTYNFQFNFILAPVTSILFVKLEILPQVVLSNTSQEFLVIVIAQIKLTKYIQLKIKLKNNIIFFINFINLNFY